MHNSRKFTAHFFTYTLVFALVFSLLSPSLSTLYHAANTHLELSCNEIEIDHFHSPEIDCAFQKVHYLPNFNEEISFFELTPFARISEYTIYSSQNTSLQHQRMYSLRAPPFAA